MNLIIFVVFGTVLLSFDSVIGQEIAAQLHCPPEGIYAAPHPKACDQYYLCTNGSLTHEFCPNGLMHSLSGAVYGFCAHQWNVNCEGKLIPQPISTPGCPWSFGFFNEDDRTPCNIYYSECLWGVPERKECQAGLFYDDRIKGCNWPDKVGCSSENLLGFKCPVDDTTNKYWPYPRYYYTNNAIITCVDHQPRLVKCAEDELVDGASLTCQAVYKEDKPKYN
jgi:hypothetical protein